MTKSLPFSETPIFLFQKVAVMALALSRDLPKMRNSVQVSSLTSPARKVWLSSGSSSAAAACWGVVGGPGSSPELRSSYWTRTKTSETR